MLQSVGDNEYKHLLMFADDYICITIAVTFTLLAVHAKCNRPNKFYKHAKSVGTLTQQYSQPSMMLTGK